MARTTNAFDSSSNLPEVPRPIGSTWRALESEGIDFESQVLVVGGGADLAARLILTKVRLVLVANGEILIEVPRTWLRPAPRLMAENGIRLFITPDDVAPSDDTTERITLRAREGRGAAAQLISIVTGRAIAIPNATAPKAGSLPAELPTWNATSGAAPSMALPPLPDFAQIMAATEPKPTEPVNPSWTASEPKTTASTSERSAIPTRTQGTADETLVMPWKRPQDEATARPEPVPSDVSRAARRQGTLSDGVTISDLDPAVMSVVERPKPSLGHRVAVWGLRAAIIVILVGTGGYLGRDYLRDQIRDYDVPLPARVAETLGIEPNATGDDLASTDGDGGSDEIAAGTLPPSGGGDNVLDDIGGTTGPIPTASVVAEVPSEEADEPTEVPAEPTDIPEEPTEIPAEPTDVPEEPTEIPVEPTDVPAEPTEIPTEIPVIEPTEEPTDAPVEPTLEPTATEVPTEEPTATTEPTATEVPTEEPTATTEPTATEVPTEEPAATTEPTATEVPTETPSPEATATEGPTETPSPEPTATATSEPTVVPTPTLVPQEPSVDPDATPDQQIAEDAFRYSITGASVGSSVPDLPEINTVDYGQWVVLTVTGENTSDSAQVFDMSQFTLIADGAEVNVDVGNAWVASMLGFEPAYASTDAIQWASGETHQFALTFLAPLDTTSLLLQVGDQTLDVSYALNGDNTLATTDTSATQPDYIEAPVVEVVNAETIVVEIDGVRQTVRYLGLDAPTGDNDCYAEDATAANAALVEGKTVRIERQATNVDARGNWVRDVWVANDDGVYQLVSAQLVSEGAAKAGVTEPNTRFQGWLLGSEASAKAQGLGLWASCGTDTDAASTDGGDDTDATSTDTSAAVKPSTDLARD